MKEKINNDEIIGISIIEAGRRLGIGRNNMLKLANTRNFPCMRLNKKIIVNANKLENWFDNQI